MQLLHFLVYFNERWEMFEQVNLALRICSAVFVVSRPVVLCCSLTPTTTGG